MRLRKVVRALPLALSALLAGADALGSSSEYEQRLIDWGVSLHGRQVEPEPEGKRVEEILVASEDIIAPSDPYPLLFNLVHVRTREQVIRQELLLEEGAPYQTERAAETERNLRRLFILAIARVVPLKGRDGGVGVLVVTKDRWSLRLESEFNFVGDLLQYLRLRPTEQNFLGRNQQVMVDFILRLDTLSVGQLYQDRRFLGSELYVGETAALILNRQTQAPEGSTGKAVVGLPLRTLESTWGFWTEGEWRVQRRRVFRGAQVWALPHPDGGTVPFAYDLRDVTWSAVATRSFGRRFKTDLTFGLGGHLRRYTAPTDGGLEEDRRSWLEANYLPRSEDAAYLTATVRAYSADYRVLRGIETFALSEDFQLGPSVVLSARWAEPLAYARSRFVEVGASARYRALFREDLFSLTVAGAARHQPEAGGLVNQRAAVELVNVSPPLEGGRVVLRTMIDLRRADLDHQRFLLGGGNGLRGAPAESLAGRNLALMNLEYRTRPVELRTLYLGFVLFWDAGSAFDEAPSLTHTLGLGARLLIPQFNQETVRFDLGMVVGGDPREAGDRFSGSYGQITDYRSAFLDRPL